MPVVTLLNQKGGVGKTSTCFHSASTLAAMGKRVLLIDADPQASLTQGFFGSAQARDVEASRSVAAIFAGEEPFPDQVIFPAGIAGVDLIPGSGSASVFNFPEPHLADWQLQVSLREFLAEVRDKYDLVLIDVPPNLHLCSWAALVASDAMIVPMQPEDFGAQGIADVRVSVERVQSGPNPNLKVLGYLVTMLQPSFTVHKAFIAKLRATYGDLVFETMIPRSVDFIEAIVQRRPVGVLKPKGIASKSMKALAEELIARLSDAPRIATPQEAA